MADDKYVDFRDTELKKYLKDLDKKFKTVKGADTKYIGLLSSVVYRDIIDHFTKEEGAKSKWLALNPDYEAWKRKKKKTKMLVLSGALRQGFTPIKSGKQAKKYQGGILWYNPVKYSGKHDRGEGVPMREFMWLSDKAVEDISKQTLAFILDNK